MNKQYTDLLSYLMPPWDDRDIDVELRLASILGMQGSGKTTLAMTIANDLYERFGDSFACLYGFWLHRLLPKAVEMNVLRNKKHVLIVVDDATAFLHSGQSRKLLAKDYMFFWRLRHLAREGGVSTYTAKIALIINMHSYMTITKYLRNTHVLIVKSVMPRWQRYEHEDVSLRWLDSMVARELTRMRYGMDRGDVTAALNKALAAYFTGETDIIKYAAKKKWPPNTFTDLDTGIDMDIDGNREIIRPPISQKAFVELVKSLDIHADEKKIRELYRKIFGEILGFFETNGKNKIPGSLEQKG